MRIPGTNAHLTYCLNVHPGGTLAEAERAIFAHAPKVFAEFSRLTGVKGPYGLGIWLSAKAAEELAGSEGTRALRERLARAGFYALTFNGFPYGRFHGTRVKEKVYRPDWAEPDRLHFTMHLLSILADLLPSEGKGTISTLPVTFRPWADGERVEFAAERLGEAAGELDWVGSSMGSEITLALEPEPGCYLERTDDVTRFFENQLLPRGCELLREEDDLDTGAAEAIIRRHIGVCLDTVHTGVMGEDPKEAVQQYAAASIRVAKVQLGAALRVQVGPDGPPEALRAFQDEVYLHQTVVATPDGRELYFNDLPEPLGMDAPPQGEWRVHFHVPLAWPGEGGIGTTASQVDEAFLAAALAAGCEHFESEIYTLDVFPAARDSREAILAQDLAWLWQRFQAIRQ
ncbi:MAG: TIM barrel protein [Planctomycetes bacterium]|nr:TIM barrel protein [Planctomycetota bacterium]